MITLRDAELFRIELRARMPFRYGIATMTDLPHVILRLTFDFDGATQAGLAADHLPPKWFTKDPMRPPGEEIEEMLAVIRAAIAHTRSVKAATPFAFWRELYETQAQWAKEKKIPPLLAHFGTSLVERALIDAFCRLRGATFAGALRENIFGIELGALRPELAGTAPRDWLPASPPAEIFARHTVGLSDPLDEGDLAPGERVDDGLPQTLVECVRFYGLRHFKIKINGDAPRDRARIARMAEIFAAECGGDYAFSLDGNESFRDAAGFADFARGLLSAGPAEFWARLLFIEQPLHREVALTEASNWARVWPERPPIIIDESDGELASLPQALALGYAGTSHKNCKGIFKSVANACLLAQHRSAGRIGLLSGEDLSNVGPVALLQDLAAQAALGVTSVERNGHHYFAGLSQFPATLQAHVLAHHGDLFIRGAANPSTGLRVNWPRVDVRGGKIVLGSVLRAPFGYAGEPDLSSLMCVKS